MATLDNIFCVCRVCLAEDKIANLKNMFNFSIRCNDEKTNFSQLYLDYTGISLNADEEISPYCCTKCETAMIIAFNFRKAVKESHEFLEHIFKKIQTFEETNPDISPDDEKAQKVSQLKTKIYSHIYCRSCYLESDTLCNIYETNYKETSLHNIFKTLVGNFVMPKNGLSESICKSCETQMIQIYDGRISARKNDAYMKKSLEEALKAIQEGKLDIEKYRVDKDMEDEIANADTSGPLLEPEFIKLEPVETEDFEIKEEIEDLPEDNMQFD